MPKYLLTWNEKVINNYAAHIDADSEEEAWEILESGDADYGLWDWNLIDTFDRIAEIVE